MVKVKKLDKKSKEALKNAGRCKIAGPGSRPGIDPNKINKIAEKIKVEINKSA